MATLGCSSQLAVSEVEVMKWFGPASWGAPICEEAERAEPPTGDGCLHCLEPIENGDQDMVRP